ncbi:hypothetical protein ABEV34_03775 [Methylorubrum rhodesianum]|jgi:hypothetical protein|uniref:Uncharacterized protein n=1 Tax=Methylorubrum rhodesianum TaxID=29427 RepID=A0ABU9Z6H1_9HYPH|nr:MULTISPECIES: hypothetical protein [Methylorubrum]MBY0141294.1 hypothetical protein [Methylorubrum populi]MRI57023.1 hypothetical protein [Methylobacterium sp. DB1607]MBB5760438.1 hypothetical protein [Methylorubrum rhodesianum]MBI1690586.1 hypothetical protein [Methylorubrum sp. DB1722]MBK3401992.1 hypothetical protein [Methylorubrum rhodesianum]
MFRTTFPQEAVGHAHALIGAYETAHTGLARISQEFRRDLRVALDRLGPGALPYLRVIRSDLEGRTLEARATWPLWIDRLTDPMIDRRLIASRALLDAVEREADARGMRL